MKNLLYNADFELWTYPNTGPDGWTFAGVGSRWISREPSFVKTGNYASKQWCGAASGDYSYIYANVHSQYNIDYLRGRTFKLGGWVWCDTASGAYIALTDNIIQNHIFNTVANTWQWVETQPKTIINSADIFRVRIVVRSRTESDGHTAYFDGLVLLEGCWVPQTPYDFEDVEFRLGPTSATSIVLYPDEGMELGKYLMHNTQRAADGHLYGYEFGTYHKSSIPVQFMPSSDAAIVNSWWESQAKLLLFVTSGPVTAVHSCMIMGETCPMSQISKPYDDRFKGVIPLEGY